MATVAGGSESPVGTKLGQIDILKGLAALAVVATHSYKADELVSTWAVLHIWQAVPVFIIILGVTSALSFSRRAGVARLSPDYIRRRAVRILGPFIIVWLLAALIGRARGQLNLGLETLALKLPYGGPGNYFVPVVVILLLLAPVMYTAYRRAPVLTLCAAFAVDLTFELGAGAISLFTEQPYLHSIVALRYLAAFTLGFFLVDERVRPRVKWSVLAVGAMGSLAYLVVGNLGLANPPFVTAWGTQNVLAVFYPALLVAGGLAVLPKNPHGVVFEGLAAIGTASYHIFLMQMIFFLLVGQGNSKLVVVSLVVCTFMGVGFYVADQALGRRLRDTASAQA